MSRKDDFKTQYEQELLYQEQSSFFEVDKTLTSIAFQANTLLRGKLSFQRGSGLCIGKRGRCS